MANQDNDFKWFQENLEDLYKKYPEQYLVISNEEVKGHYSSFSDAIDNALKTMNAGEFIVQECTSRDTTARYYNRSVYIA